MSEAGTAVTVEEKREPREKKSRVFDEKNIWKRGSVFWIQYYKDGKQIRESTGSKVLQVAKRKLRKRLGEKELGILANPRNSRVTVDELYEDKHAELLKYGRPKTAAWLKSRWELRLKEPFGKRRARDIHTAYLDSYQTKQMEQFRDEFPDATAKEVAARETMVNSDLAALRMMFSHGQRLGKVDTIPVFPKYLVGAPKREGTVTSEQFEAMLAACGADELYLKTFLVMAYNQGYRLRELLGLQCVRVNLAERTVYLPPRSTKNRRPRRIPISNQELPLLQACLAGKRPEDFVLTRADGSHVRDIRVPWDRIVEKAKAGHEEIDLEGNKTWYPAMVHDLRRSAISRMLSGGMPPDAVRKIVGHFDPAMTERYFNPSVDTLLRLQQEAEVRLESLGNRDKKGTIAQLPEVTGAQAL